MSLSVAKLAVMHARTLYAVNARCLKQLALIAAALQRFRSVPVKTVLFIAASASQK